MLRKVHKASYSSRTWVPKLAMVKVAGHRDGFVQLYRAGIWCSIEQDAAFKGLFDNITPVSDAQLAEAETFMEGRREWAGLRATLVALRNYIDVILQDLVAWCVHPVMGADYLAATHRFPFLAAKDRQHNDWVRFVDASCKKAAALRDADRDGHLAGASDTRHHAACAGAAIGCHHRPHLGGDERPGRSKRRQDRCCPVRALQRTVEGGRAIS